MKNIIILILVVHVHVAISSVTSNIYQYDYSLEEYYGSLGELRAEETLLDCLFMYGNISISLLQGLIHTQKVYTYSFTCTSSKQIRPLP